MSGAVTAASNVLPYSDEVPILCDNTRNAWKERLAELLEQDLDRIWREQHQWVMTHRNIDRNVTMWEEVFAGGQTSATIPQTAEICTTTTL